MKFLESTVTKRDPAVDRLHNGVVGPKQVAPWGLSIMRTKVLAHLYTPYLPLFDEWDVRIPNLPTTSMLSYFFANNRRPWGLLVA